MKRCFKLQKITISMHLLTCNYSITYITFKKMMILKIVGSEGCCLGKDMLSWKRHVILEKQLSIKKLIDTVSVCGNYLTEIILGTYTNSPSHMLLIYSSFLVVISEVQFWLQLMKPLLTAVSAARVTRGSPPHDQMCTHAQNIRLLFIIEQLLFLNSTTQPVSKPKQMMLWLVQHKTSSTVSTTDRGSEHG